jgi:hypothetical protein
MWVQSVKGCSVRRVGDKTNAVQHFELDPDTGKTGETQINL